MNGSSSSSSVKGDDNNQKNNLNYFLGNDVDYGLCVAKR